MKWRNGITLTGLTCWLGMVPACALFHGNDTAAQPPTPPKADTSSTAQSATDRSKSNSPYWASPSGQEPKPGTPVNSRPVFRIEDKPKAIDKTPGANSDPFNTYPNLPNIGAPQPNRPAPLGGQNDVRVPADLENPVKPPDRAPLPPLPAQIPPDRPVSVPPLPAQIRGYSSPDQPPTAKTVPPKASERQVVEIAQPTSVEQSAPAKDAPLLNFMRLYLDKRPAEAISQLSAYDKTRQDLLLGLLSMAAGLTEQDPTKISPEQIQIILNQLKGIAAPLAPKAPFALTAGTLCALVQDHAQYDKLPPDYVYPSGGHMEVYVELLNFATLHRNGGYEIWLSAEADIYDEAGKIVPNTHVVFNKGGPEVNRTWTARREFHRGYTLSLPSWLPAGRYKLRLQVTDETPTQVTDETPTKRNARQFFTFTVAGPIRRT